MKFYILIILCLLQGLTEFLPISSSGHLLIAEKIFDIKDNVLLLNLFLHLATLFAVITVYRKNIWQLIKKPFQPLMYKLIISTIITIAFAGCYEIFNLGKILDNYFGYYFLITGILLLITYLFQKHSAIVKFGEIGYKSSIFSGIMQGFAVLPGISRSGSTISVLTILGNNESKSAEYSFLLSIPIIIGGFIFELINVNDFENIFNMVSVWELIFAFAFTFIIAIASIKFTVKLLKNNKFIYFSIYLFIVGILVLIFF